MTGRSVRAFPFHPLTLALILLVSALTLSVFDLAGLVPSSEWWQAIWFPDRNNLAQVLVHHAMLPRVVMALLCGAALALAGLLFQQILRNPLAEPATLGVSAGAYLAIAVATFTAPLQLLAFREAISLTGATLAGLIVFVLGWSKTLSPMRLILAGLVVNLSCGAVATALALFHDQSITSLYLWASGNLAQHDWDGVLYLLPRLAGAGIVTIFLLRPLALSGLNEEMMTGLGLSPLRARFLGLVVAVSLTAFVVSAVGNIGFIGLAAPGLARLAGARRLRDQVLWAPAIGAGLLWLADDIASRIGIGAQQLPAGAMTALIGAPLLLLLLPHLNRGGEVEHVAAAAVRTSYPAAMAGLVLGLFILLLWIAISFAQGLHGWNWATGEALDAVLPWRLPRIAGALSAGAMLAAAGCLVQRLTGNGMASPEVLGIGAGSVLGLIVALLLGLPFDAATQVVAAFSGAVVTLGVLLIFSARAAFAANRMLLSGIAINTVFVAVVALFIGSGDPRGLMLLRVVSGSTYLVEAPMALGAVVMTIILLILILPLGRWLAILPLGGATASSVGLSLARSRMLILIVAALLTACGTLIAGPMSFVGLMAPHMARLLGFGKPLPQLVTAVLLGGALMVAADWIGRMALFPNELPAGLVATLLGGPYFLWLMRPMRRQGR